MVNKTFLPSDRVSEKPLSHLQTCISSTGTAFAEKAANPSLAWESWEGSRGSAEAAWESSEADHIRGEPPMQNMHLIGLSRQMVLERQMDVVANNVANVNTTGFKADRSLFAEHLMPGAHEDNFVAGDRRLSYVNDRATFHDFSQGVADPNKNPLDVAI